MLIQIEVRGDLEKSSEEHRKKHFPHLNKRAYIIEMLRQRVELDKTKDLPF